VIVVEGWGFMSKTFALLPRDMTFGDSLATKSPNTYAMYGIRSKK
jgi:hypothetical protein